MRNLHRITGATFEHSHPECVTCAHRQPGSMEGWCRAKGKTLCCPKPRKCREYRPAASPTPTEDRHDD